MEDVGYALWKFEIETSPEPFLRGYGLPLNARDAVDYAKQREREFERFEPASDVCPSCV